MSRYVIDEKDLVAFLIQYRKRTNPTANEAAAHFLQMHGHHVSKVKVIPITPHYHVWQLNESGQNVCAECGVLR